jgi:Uma2 family endonuclease
MTTTLEKLERLDEPILIDEPSWREFKAVEQLLSRPGVRLSFLDGVLEIRRRPGRKHETAKQRIQRWSICFWNMQGLTLRQRVRSH